MKITTIQISGFRKILKATINMEDDITVIAGANNSGKTSIVELFNYVFNAKGALCSDDFPVYESQEWCTAVFPYFQAQFKQENKKDDLIANILGTIVPSENPENEMLLTPIEVLIQVDYDPAGDDIRNFADYIMELDPDNSSFYFIYRFELDKDLLRKSLDSEYEKLCNRFDKLVGDDDKDAEGIRIIKEMLIQIYTDSSKDATYFSDKTYSNIVPMDVASFRGLFNYQNIMAGRTLDDGNSDRAKILSKNMIDIASQEDNWKTLIQSLPDKIKQSIEDEQIQQEVRKASIETLGKTIEQISKTNGGQAGNITIDMVVTDEAVQSLLKSITSAKYQVDNFFLRESSQGLGYSNLIFIHLQLEKYRKTIDPLLVNFFVIEEPEAHMHPQMQNVFSQYLFAYYSKESAMQGFVTTHSHEVVRNSRISQLRVLRQVKPFECCLYDLHRFIDEVIKPNQKLKDLIEFYDGFYAINFPDIIFADKVILYEGDTERMLIKNALLSERFEALRNQYIDEYQDTMSDVLKIFFESVHNTKTKLFLFGDRMQQIYKNYDGSFEESFELFDTTKALTTNYRSTKSIVNILNRIYNDPAFVQNISEKMRSTDSDFDPRIIISHSIQAEIENLRKTDPDTLILYLFNKERFSDIDAIHLYDAFNSMEKYSFGKAVSAVDVLTTRYEDNPDALLKVLFCVVDLLKLYKAQQYGNIIQILKGNKSIFSKESWNIQTHNDKETVFNSIKQVFNIIENIA